MDREESFYLTILKDTTDVLSHAGSLGETLTEVLEIVARRLAFEVCSAYLIDGQRIRMIATYGLPQESVGIVEMALSEGLVGLVAQEEKPLFLADAQRHPRFKYFPETGEERFKTFGGVPLIRKGKCIGVIAVKTLRAHHYRSNEISMLQALAGQIVSLIDLSRHRGQWKEQILTGIGTSPGIGIASAHVLGKRTLTKVPDLPFRGIEVEIGAVRSTLSSTQGQLRETALALNKKSQADAAGIIEAQAFFLGDPALAARIEKMINEQRVPAARAVDIAFTESMNRLDEMSNPIFREKVHDLLDIRELLLRNLGITPETDGSSQSRQPVVRVAEFLTPAQTADLDPQSVVAIATEHGSFNSHASIVARSLGIPAVMGIRDLADKVKTGDRLLVDGNNGFVLVNPDAEAVDRYQTRQEETKGPHQSLLQEHETLLDRQPPAGYSLAVNLGLPGEIQIAQRYGATSIGLLRTEFFYMRQSHWPSVDEQMNFYRMFLKAFPDGEVTVRLLDVGGDKHLPYLAPAEDQNPYLGFRSIRFLLEHADTLRTQIRAMLRAASAEKARLSVLVPLVTTPSEMESVREIYDEVAREEGLAESPPLGMMIEVPAVIFDLPAYGRAGAQFFSVGTNDFIQYLLAVDRNNEQVKNLYSPFHPAVLRALARISDELSALEAPFGICGEMAGNPAPALALLALGFRNLSVQPHAYPQLLHLVRRVEAEFLVRLREEILALSGADQVERQLRIALRGKAPLLCEI